MPSSGKPIWEECFSAPVNTSRSLIRMTYKGNIQGETSL